MAFTPNRSVFRVGSLKSGGALRAESLGYESAKDAAKRLKIRDWEALEEFSDDCDDLGLRLFAEPYERHHLNVRHNVGQNCRIMRTEVLLVAYRKPEEWNEIARAFRAKQ